MKTEAAGGGSFGMPSTGAVVRPQFSEFGSICEFLFAQKAHGTKFGIDRMRTLVAELGHPERVVPCVHVAGTNGKGSVAAMLDAILRTAGWQTGLYTSPHLVHVGERVQVDRRPLTEREIVDYVRELEPIAARIGAVDSNLRPSFFEYLTAMAFLHFARRRCDWAVFEVGLGGRLDATNVVTPEVAVITSIGYDHCELLGNTLAEIAAEKAGIIKPGVPVVVGHMPREAEKIIRATAAQIGAPLISVAEHFGETLERLPRTNLEGEYQRWNAATATLAAQQMSARGRITSEVIQRGLMAVDWPGRWQRVTVGGHPVILDASHNPEGAETLDRNLRQLVFETGRAPIVIVGVLGAARARPLIETICRFACEVWFVVPNQARACSYEELVPFVPSSFRGSIVRGSVERAFPTPNQCAVGTGEDTVVVTGSIYLLGEVMSRLAAPTGTTG